MTATASPIPHRLIFESAVQELRGRGLVEGAMLVSRDGFPLAGDCPGLGDREVFSAMHATALGAAQIALQATGSAAGVSLLAKLEGRRFVSQVITDHFFVVALLTRGTDCQDILAWMDGLRESLA
jgi:predicted regulator of Ras-like GTPase activity (Roadblock/LC7/MglB family)